MQVGRDDGKPVYGGEFVEQLIEQLIEGAKVFVVFRFSRAAFSLRLRCIWMVSEMSGSASRDHGAFIMRLSPLVSVVVYCEPGPEQEELSTRAIEHVVRRSPWQAGGAVGYLVLVRRDFERLRRGIAKGEAVGTAAGVLACLGPTMKHLIGRPQDLIYSWSSDAREEEGTLLLQVLPRLDAQKRCRCEERPTRRAEVGFA